MAHRPTNHYERAFENWLIDHRIEYSVLDEHRPSEPGPLNVKCPDFTLISRRGRPVIAEVKGRRFRGTNVVGLAGFECWVTAADVEGLTRWAQAFGAHHEVVFVFAYRIEQVDVDFNGRDVFEYGSDRYLFLGVTLADYRRHMKQRSPKWKTVTMPADRFRESARDLRQWLL